MQIKGFETLEIIVGVLYIGTISSIGLLYNNILGEKNISMIHGTIKLFKKARVETILKNKFINYFICLWSILIFALFIIVLITF